MPDYFFQKKVMMIDGDENLSGFCLNARPVGGEIYWQWAKPIISQANGFPMSYVHFQLSLVPVFSFAGMFGFSPP